MSENSGKAHALVTLLALTTEYEGEQVAEKLSTGRNDWREVAKRIIVKENGAAWSLIEGARASVKALSVLTDKAALSHELTGIERAYAQARVHAANVAELVGLDRKLLSPLSSDLNEIEAGAETLTNEALAASGLTSEENQERIMLLAR